MGGGIHLDKITNTVTKELSLQGLISVSEGKCRIYQPIRFQGEYP